MLTIFKLLKKNKLMRIYNDEGQSVSIHRRHIPSNKEWYNSVYAFNKKSLRFLPAIHDYVFKLLKGYFNLVNQKMEADVSSRKYKKIRRSSGHKVWVSTPEVKHLAQEVNITVYVYNRVYNVYKSKLDQVSFTWGPLFEEKTNEHIRTLIENKRKVPVKPSIVVVDQSKIGDTSFVETNTVVKTSTLENKFHYIKRQFSTYQTAKVNSKFFSTSSKILSNQTEDIEQEVYQESSDNSLLLSRKIRSIKQEHPTYLGRNKSIDGTNYYANMIKWLKLDKLVKIEEYKATIMNHLDTKKTNLFESLSLMKFERYNYLINQFRKELVYLKFKQKLAFNQYKFNEIYTRPLIEYLQMIYKKNVKLNVIVLKNYYLNTSILLQIIETKLKKDKARGRHLRTVDRAMSRIRIPELSSNKLQRLEKKNIDMQNVILDNFETRKEDRLDQFLANNNIMSKNDVHSLVLKNLENKSISGLFIKISGRLTKRYKAQRAVSTLRAKGTLKNVHSAHSGLPSVLSKGYSNINVEKAMIHSKNRIGAFGLSGWIASY